MSIESRVEITLYCNAKKDGPDYRASLPTILKGTRRLLESLVYCASNPKPVRYFDERWFVKCLSDVDEDGMPEGVEGAWEFGYVGIPFTEEKWQYPAKTLENMLLPEFLKLLAGWKIDAGVYRFHIRQWYLDTDPDDSADFDLSDEDAVLEAYREGVLPEDVMKTCFSHLLV